MFAPKVLVVDDQPVNVQLLKRALERENIAVIPAHSGQEALDLVERDRPQLILLDVMMPEMDGIEVCQRLQQDSRYKNIPVMFITARSSKEGRLAGLGVGAVDYITKPIDLDETLARVHTQLRVVAVNREMIDLQRRLEEARRAASIGAITQGIAHNLNNLLGVALGYLDLIKINASKPDAVRSNAENLEAAMQRIVSIIRQLSSLVVKSRLPTIPIPLDQLIENALLRFRTEQRHEDEILVENPLGALAIHTHVEMFEDALSKVLVNARESYGEHHRGLRPIAVRASISPESAPDGRLISLEITDSGRGIDRSVQDNLFEPFISTKNTVGVGMGLTVARHSLRNMGGDLVLANRPGGGVVATLCHPVERRRRSSYTI
ncbi:MAG: hybrid sensor histidine kinase/response regulator [Verrucomicrobia bacterium]|nr:MAG: hybrid sensor histidine kinase/response regulator [Verrucomicrobiota bacterium]